jgi:tetratricopeptide (TPR) repeat protein
MNPDLVEKKQHQFNLKWVNRATSFFKEIGLPFVVVPSYQADPPDIFFKGCWLEAGKLHFCPKRVQVGELLHEAGHLALLPRSLWAELKPGTLEVETLYGDPGAEAWDYAAAIVTGIPLFMVFTQGFAGQSWDALMLFDQGIHPGIRLLEEGGLAAPFPRMKRWFVREGDIEKSQTTKPLQEFDRQQKPKAITQTVPQDLKKLQRLASEHLRNGRLFEAGELFHQIVQIAPNNAAVIHDVGAIMYQQGNYEASLSLVNRAIKIDPNLPSAHYTLGNLWGLQGKQAEAIASYQKALALKPDFAEAHYTLGNVLAAQEKHEDAIASYQKALAINPNVVETYYGLGNALAAQGKQAEAIASYQKALALKPGFAEVHYVLGDALAAQGSTEEAIASYRQALVANPNSSWAAIVQDKITKLRSQL